MEILNELSKFPVTINTIIGWVESKEKELSNYIIEYGTGWTCIIMTNTIKYLFASDEIQKYENEFLMQVEYQNNSVYHILSLIHFDNILYLVEMWNGNMIIHNYLLKDVEWLLKTYNPRKEYEQMKRIGTPTIYKLRNITDIKLRLQNILDIYQLYKEEYRLGTEKLFPNLEINEFGSKEK
mgnify:FL=1